MKRVLAALLLSVTLAFPVRALEPASAGLSMVDAMWDFMQWFLQTTDPIPNSYALPWRYGGPIASWYTPYNALRPPRRHGWGNPWLEPQVLEGVWLAASGEYWMVRGERFVLVTRMGRRFTGRFHREGPFILAQLPQGEIEFEYRLMDDVLVLRDLMGRVVTLRRLWRPGWAW